MADDSRIDDHNREENELMLELSIGGIFGKPNRSSPNVNELKEIEDELNVNEPKRENQAEKRKELRRKREEKLKKTVCFGSVGAPSVLGTQVGQNDDVLEIEHVRKKEKVVENGNVNGKKCVVRPTVCRSFWPGNDNVNVKGSGGEDEMESDGGRRNCKVSSNGSGGGGGGSSAYSDGQCSSHQGGGTDDSRSISSNSQHDQQLPSTSTASNPFDPSDQPGSSKQTVSTKLTDSTISDPNSIKPNDQLTRHESSASNPSSKLDTSNQHHQPSVMARMPCVSTTGNGPNGKTVSGFLYRYTKNEVSIVCVCHGDSFSPAGFVEHAGGVNITHPLKHITIFPTAFAS